MKPPVLHRVVLPVIGLALIAGAILAASEVVLQDGQVVSGTEVRREGDNYLVTVEGGNTVVVPTALVQEVRLEEEPEPAEPDEEATAETGLVESKPQQLAGTPVTPSTPSEQLEVFGKPAQFQGNAGIDPEWHPTSDWDNDPEKNNNWAPSKWAKSNIDPEWHPEPAYDPNADVLAQSRSTFQKSPIDNSWTPTNGFAN